MIEELDYRKTNVINKRETKKKFIVKASKPNIEKASIRKKSVSK